MTVTETSPWHIMAQLTLHPIGMLHTILCLDRASTVTNMADEKSAMCNVIRANTMSTQVTFCDHEHAPVVHTKPLLQQPCRSQVANYLH